MTNPQTEKINFEPLTYLVETYSIKYSNNIFNLEESEFPITSTKIRRVECRVENGQRESLGDNHFHDTYDHLKLIPDVSVSGKALTKILIFTGKEENSAGGKMVN